VHPIGLDRSRSYLADFRRAGQPAVAASSSMLPFASASFDAVWSFAMLHHIPDDAARASIEELLRVTRPGGYAVVLDWCWPESAWRRPGAWVLLKLDRGRYMRKRQQLLALLPRPGCWSSQRAVYSLFRCEGLFCVFRKPDEGGIGSVVPALAED
jgi:SAM-dependent methyltransferase